VVTDDKNLVAAIKTFEEVIKTETLSKSISSRLEAPDYEEETKVEGVAVLIELVKVK
jgi:uncharacterized metal-binding protein